MSEFIINRRKLYILPTRVGWYFVLILFALFAIAVKFDNQPAFVMLFMLVSVGMITMVYTHNNVIGLEMDVQPPSNIFCGESAIFPIIIKNNSQKPRHAIWLLSGGFNQLASLDANEQRSFELKKPSTQRGYLQCEPTNVSSQFPIGIFFCWSKRFTPEQRCLVYPQPLNLIAHPDSADQSGKQQAKISIQRDGADYAGMKNYQPGDRLRDIHWPSLAKTNKLISIQHEQQNNSSINLSWFSLPANLSVEDKLSQLCFWVIEAEQNTTQYQLEMPNQTIEYNRGLSHYHECLTVLALWGNTTQSGAQAHQTLTPAKQPLARNKAKHA